MCVASGGIVACY